VRREVASELREAACLEPDQLAALVELGRRVEQHFGSHQDVEWAIDRDGSPLVLQARPVTAMPKTGPKLSRSALSLVMSTFGVPDGE
jgi:pyruvate,water dikinase